MTVIHKRQRVSEGSIHEVVAKFLEMALPPDAVFHHSPNEGQRGWRAQKDLKRSGMQKGWPDLEIVWQGRFYLIELKASDGVVSDDQIKTMKRLREAGANVGRICWSLTDVVKQLQDWNFPLRAHLAA